jgi:hypothetical protein
MKQAYFLLIALCFFATTKAQIVNIPDANFKAKLLAASSSNLIAKNISGNYFKIDANNDGEIQQSEANTVSELYLNFPLNGTYYYITSIIGITNFSNLTKLDLKNNKIIDLNITGMQHLSFIDCSGNDQYLTSLTLENLPLLETLNCQGAGSNTFAPVYSLLNLTSLKNINFGGCRFNSNTLDNITSLENIYGYGGLYSTVTSLDLSNKPNLKIVELEKNKLTTLTLMPNNKIETLKLFGNSLTSFNKTLFTNLKILNLGWNKLSSIDVSNITSLMELYCDNANTSFNVNTSFPNNLTFLDTQGCVNLTKLICSFNALTNLNLSGLTNLVYLDCRNNDDIFTNTGLQVLNLQNCKSLKNVIADHNPYLTELDLSCSNNYNEIRVQNCDNLKKINLKNGANESKMYTGTFSFEFSPNLSLVGVDFNENFPFLPTSIQQSPYFNFTPNCSYNTVIGNVKFDIEGDGCEENAGIEGIKIQYDSSNSDCFTFSDSKGNFIIYTQSNTINITPKNDLYPLFDFGISGPIVLNFSPNNIVENINLCLAPNIKHNDLEITLLPLEPATAGFDTKYKIVYKNNGNTIQSGAVSLVFDDTVLDLVAANPVTTIQTLNNLSWDFTNLFPFETREITFTLNLNSPIETPALIGGAILAYNATITSLATDETPTDNAVLLNQIVVNSFDPNDKTCIEGSTISPSLIGQYVHYMIRFENSGTANARNIVVKDMIDLSKFDISTLVPTNGSHSFVTNITAGNKVEFIFENINLPFDDANNDGYIAFKIKTLPTLKVGDTFTNDASIYFDYNFPIVTKLASSTFKTLGTQDFEFSNYFTIYPNPAKAVLNISSKETIEVKSISIYNTLGQLVLVVPNAEKVSKIDVSSLTTGNYFIKINSDKGKSNARFIKE